MGLLLMDTSLKPIARDAGALAILQGMSDDAPIDGQTGPVLPKEVVDIVGHYDFNEVASTKATCHVGTSDYTIRTYRMVGDAGLPPMIAMHIERVSPAVDAVSVVAAKYHLTDRELETLRGIALGLTSKELANRMKISPNTVKVFLRLIMIKMGVTNRGAVIAQILQSQSEGTSRASSARA